MLRLIVAKELREILGSPRFLGSFAAVSGLVVLAFALAAADFRAARSRHEADVAQGLRGLEGLTDWVEASPTVLLPPEPLASLVPGIADDVGRSVRVAGLGSLAPTDSRYEGEPLLATFRLFDLGFVFAVVLSLFAVLFGYDRVSGEKEGGTLRLALANAVPRATWILGKLLGGALALTLPLLVPLVAGALLWAATGVPLDGGGWTRLGLLAAAGLLYVAAFVGLSILVSTLTHRASTSFLVLLVVWVGTVLVVPRAAVLVAARTVDVPSLDEVLSQVGRLRAQLIREDQDELFTILDGIGGGDDPSATITRFNQESQARAEARAEKVAELEGRLAEERRRRETARERRALGLARLSPTAAFTLAAVDLAATSLALPDHFLGEVRRYQETLARFQREKTGGRTSGDLRMIVRMQRMGDGVEEEPKLDPRELPAFEYRPPETARLIRDAVPDLALLAFFAVLFYVAAFVAFLRYDVR